MSKQTSKWVAIKRGKQVVAWIEVFYSGGRWMTVPGVSRFRAVEGGAR